MKGEKETMEMKSKRFRMTRVGANVVLMCSWSIDLITSKESRRSSSHQQQLTLRERLSWAVEWDENGEVEVDLRETKEPANHHLSHWALTWPCDINKFGSFNETRVRRRRQAEAKIWTKRNEREEKKKIISVRGAPIDIYENSHAI